MELRGGLLIAAVVSVVFSGCSGSPGAPETVTVTQPVASIPTAVTETPAFETKTAAPAALYITLPDVTGINADLAQDQLEKLGLQNVEFASANSKYGVVVLARNWTVTGMEPAAGAAVKSGDRIILKVYKD
ncbi:PASTA domain-containing protein [Mycolicibacterium setense]|uniref:PASTA domain-containing protein n=1 Tax=Mycolicibacterium setense TaxID=431269 RepID=UPI000AE56417|nr:PASTA domain-containing protein [Mycolicibacterium setense]